MEKRARKKHPISLTLNRNGLTVDCRFDIDGRLRGKIERHGVVLDGFAYRFDDAGHLLEVKRNGRPEEEYRYDETGRRVLRRPWRFGAPTRTEGAFVYDEQGRLTRAGDTAFRYDGRGALRERSDATGVTRYAYGGDTMLDAVLLPTGEEIHYEYEEANPLGPARRFRNGELSAEYFWPDPLLLGRYKDHETLLEYELIRDGSGVLQKLGVTRMPEPRPARYPRGVDWTADSRDWLGSMSRHERRMRLDALFGEKGGHLALLCGFDQVGTPKILTDLSGKLIKRVEYDSFGIPLHDTLPDLFLPVGFAGGLADRDTGLVRFGYRDYDPGVGRFTAPDPLGDTGGDHDLYDYCVDDPVTMVDCDGLLGLPALLLLGLGGSATIAAGGMLAGGALAEGANAAMGSKKHGGKAMSGAAKMAALAQGSGLASGSLMALSALGPGAAAAYSNIGQRVGAAVIASRHGEKIIRAA